MFTNAANGLSLDIDGAATTQGAAAVLQPYTGADDQLWLISATDNMHYQIINKKSGAVLDVAQASNTQGAAIIQDASNGSANQQWHFRKIS